LIEIIEIKEGEKEVHDIGILKEVVFFRRKEEKDA